MGPPNSEHVSPIPKADFYSPLRGILFIISFIVWSHFRFWMSPVFLKQRTSADVRMNMHFYLLKWESLFYLMVFYGTRRVFGTVIKGRSFLSVRLSFSLSLSPSLGRCIRLSLSRIRLSLQPCLILFGAVFRFLCSIIDFLWKVYSIFKLFSIFYKLYSI